MLFYEFIVYGSGVDILLLFPTFCSPAITHAFVEFVIINNVIIVSRARRVLPPR